MATGFVVLFLFPSHVYYSSRMLPSLYKSNDTLPATVQLIILYKIVYKEAINIGEPLPHLRFAFVLFYHINSSQSRI